MGRSNEFKEKYVDDVDKYLDETVDSEYRLIKTDGGHSSTYENKLKVNLPTIEGFAIYIGVSVKSLYNWSDENPSFLQALGRIKSKQKKILLNKGLSGDYNSTIAKLILSSNHGMAERQEITGKDGVDLFKPKDRTKANALIDKFFKNGPSKRNKEDSK